MNAYFKAYLKIKLSIIAALISIFTALNAYENGCKAMAPIQCGSVAVTYADGYYLQECYSSNQYPSEALSAESNFAFHKTPQGRSGGYHFHKYSSKHGETGNKCGQHLHRVSLLHNSLPAITVCHKHIILLRILII